jgi:phosphoglycolate phosphatase
VADSHTRCPVVLDLDGTLVDSLPGIELSLRAALALHAPEQALPALRPHIGPPLAAIVATLCPELTDGQRTVILEAFRAHYDEVGYLHSSPYEGVPETLERLSTRGHALYVLTNKRATPTQAILAHLGWRSWFVEVVTPDPRQPDARKVGAGLALAARRGLADGLLVGDTAEDLDVATRCGWRFVHARYGYGSDLSADLAIDTFAEIERLV